MKKLNAIYLVLITLLVTPSCSQKPAHVEFKGYTFYGRNYYQYNDDSKQQVNRRDIRKDKEENDDYIKNDEEDIPTTQIAESKEKNNDACLVNNEEEITVKSGNTLYGIAIENKISAKDLITLNNLQSPYTLKVGQKLKVSSASVPTSHTVASGENLGRIAEKYNIKTVELAELNHLEKPYLIKVGQKLDLPSNSTCIASTSKTSNTTQEVKVVSNQPKTPIEAKPESKNNKFVWPVEGKVVSKFGPKEGNLYNDGINISATEGTPFRATEDGVVAYVGNELKGYGNLIIIKHAKNWVSAYAHSESVSVERGESVKKGQIIGKVGATGNVTSPQLYFGLRKGRKALDPQKYLR